MQLEEEETRGRASETLQKRMLALDYYTGDRRWAYLAGTVEEVQGLGMIATAEPRVLLGREASMSNIKGLSLDGTLLGYPIIHFALHGFFNDNLIPQSALVFSEYSGLLSGESEENGFLSIELYIIPTPRFLQATEML